MDSQSQGAKACERGEAARREKRPADARAAFAEAVEFFRASGPDGDLAHALTRRAQIERDMGKHDAALRDQEEALSLYREMANQNALPHVIRHLADILQDAGRHEEAAPYYREMLVLYSSRNDVPPLEIANAMRSVALHAEYAGDTAEARRLWRDVRERYAALDELFHRLTGVATNPGVIESDKHLAALP